VKDEDGEKSSTIRIENPVTLSSVKIVVPNKKKTKWSVLSIPSDKFPSDDRFSFVCGVPPKSAAGLFTEEKNIEIAIEAAFNPWKEKENFFSVRKIGEPELLNENIAPLSFFISDGLPRRAEKIKILIDFVEKGGGLLIFSPENIPEGGIQISPRLRFVSASDAPSGNAFKADKHILSNGPIHEDLGNTLCSANFAKRALIEGDFTVIAKFQDGRPLLCSSSIGLGTVYIFCAPIGSKFSNFTENPVFPVMIRKIMFETADKNAGFKNIDAYYLSTPDGEEAKRLDEAKTAVPFVKTGVYQFNGKTVAVNAPDREKEFQYLENDELKEILSGKIKASFLGDPDEKSFLKEFWRHALVLAMLFLIAEQALCGCNFKTDFRGRMPLS
jgi:hypothetical protein